MRHRPLLEVTLQFAIFKMHFSRNSSTYIHSVLKNFKKFKLNSILKSNKSQVCMYVLSQQQNTNKYATRLMYKLKASLIL